MKSNKIKERLDGQYDILLAYIRKFGIKKGILLLLKFYFPHINNVVSVKLPNLQQPIQVRIGTSDIQTFLEVFVRDEYDLSFLGLNPRTIIDGGANVGFSSLYFACLYPCSRIIAFEPEFSNFEMLKRNTEEYENITPVQAALWTKESELAIKNPEAEKWAFQVTDSAQEFKTIIKGHSITKIITDYNLKNIDVLKLDIEGSEKDIFESNVEAWIGKVRVMIIELHDRFKPGCTASVINAACKNGFDIVQLNNLIVLNRHNNLSHTT